MSLFARMLKPTALVPRVTRSLPVLIALALAPAGCDAEVSPIEVAPSCPQGPVRRPSEGEHSPDPHLIDDFESGDLMLPRNGGRDGGWVVGWDMTFDELKAEAADECAGRGTRAGHFAGHGFRDWGANWTAVLRRQDDNGKAVAYDATSYHGISLWAALGDSAGASLTVPVGVTTMDNAWNGGICSECMDYYRTTITLSGVWQQFQIRFADLAQRGTGDPLVALRRDQLVGFIIWPEQDFDIWLDDLRFEP